MTDKNNIPKLLQVLDDLESNKIEIGIFGSDDSTILMIATVNEFGCKIDVTPKMRAYLHSQGLHLKDSRLYSYRLCRTPQCFVLSPRLWFSQSAPGWFPL
jgi:hypothetical protein